jgi:outer membrane protein OmpA-like peptidoglycan-associated protein
MKKILMLGLVLLWIVSCGGSQAAKPEQAPQQEEPKKEETKQEEEQPQQVQKEQETASFQPLPSGIEERAVVMVFDFEVGKARVPQDAVPAIKETAGKINAVLSYWKDNQVDKTVRVKIYGYADVRGSREFNQKLSVKRAENITEMIKNQLQTTEKVEFEVRGFGFAELYAPKDPQSGKNRRVAIVVEFS